MGYYKLSLKKTTKQKQQNKLKEYKTPKTELTLNKRQIHFS